MLLLKHLHILPMAGPGPMNGDILLENGKIRALGRELSAPGAQVLELEGLYAMPGMVDAHCHIGMWEDGNMIEGDDGNETSGPITPELRAIDAINPFDRCFAEACAAGVTACVTGPGSANVIGGQFAALKTRPGSVEDKLIQAPLAMKAALGENPKRVYTAQKSSPQTRMATAALLRRALLEAQAYAKKRAEKEGADFDMAKEALLPVLRGELPLKIHAHRADDILTAIRIAEEFHLRFSLEHCTEGYLIPEAIRQAQDAGAKVIIGPLLTDRSKVELRNLTFQAPKLLHDQGIEFALMTDHPVVPLQYLPVCAALAVREGLDEDTALKTITLHGARAVGLEDRLGSLEPGKDGDVAIFRGHPLDVRSRCVMTLIDGQIVHDQR